ncbi:MAG TPA: AAA family ATPase [Agitococcus sp.]|nr:AAA family ATPase [Agitococcus sp.]HMX98948.1 AAA family ATPase [Agitococcus sp.]HNC03335.1 AAA family ATPase [Agitococcus sp.]
MKPTEEQIAAINSALEGITFKISAYAGSGKTSTLKLIGNTLSDQQGIYLAFNKAIADDAKKRFPQNVKCQTFHSLAFKQTPDYIKEKLNFNRLLPRKMAEMLCLQDYRVPLRKYHSASLTTKEDHHDSLATTDSFKESYAEYRTCTSYDQAMILNRAIGLYCRSKELTVTPAIIIKAMPQWIDEADCRDLIGNLATCANILWKKLIDEHTPIKITHIVEPLLTFTNSSAKFRC